MMKKSGLIIVLMLFIFTAGHLTFFNDNILSVQESFAQKKKGKGKKKGASKGGAGKAELKSGKEQPWVDGGEKFLAISLSSDGKTAVSVSMDGIIKFWDVESGKITRLIRHGGKLSAAAFLEDKKIVMASDWAHEGNITMLDLSTGKKVATRLGHKGGVTTVAFLPGGKSALSGGWDSQMMLWGGEHGEIALILKEHDGAIRSMSVSQDRAMMASGSADGKIKVWDMKGEGQVVKKIKAHKKGVLLVAFSPDGRFILSGGEEKEKGKMMGILPGKKTVYPIKIWDAATGKPILVDKKKKSLGEHAVELTLLRYSPDGKLALSGDKDGVLKLWDVTAQTELRTFDGRKGGIETGVFSSDGRFVLAGGAGALTLWETETGKVVASGAAPAEIATSTPAAP
ncbi:MAG: WD40 repeat domain-containing protein [Nitrospirota bacterium]